MDNPGVPYLNLTANSNDVYNTDNRVDNRIDNSVNIHLQTVYQQNLEVLEERVHKLLQMLSPLEPLKRHQDIRSTRLENTGAWLLEHGRFQAWRNGALDKSVDRGRVLCCFGMPGAGKTFMSSQVIDYLHLPITLDILVKVGIACLYCDYRDQRMQTPVHIIGSFLQQLILGTFYVPPPIINSIVDTLGHIAKQKKIVEKGDILNMLKLVIEQLDCTFICIDALDELTPQTRRELLEMLKAELGNTRLFLTGRHHVHTDLSRMLNIHMEDCIDIKASLDDIQAYLIKHLKQDTNPDAMNTWLREEILTIIPTKSEGMFLLPALHIAMVLVPPTIAKRRKALGNLPSDLDSVFHKMVERIQQSPSYAELGMQVLMWLHLAYRPLKVRELAHALAVQKEDTELDEDNIPAQTAILTACIGLAIVDDETSTVRFVHYTLEEFFTKHSSQYFSDSSTYAAEICLMYLTLDKVRLPCTTISDLKRRKNAFAFLEYSASYWGCYIRCLEGDSYSVRRLVLRLLEGEEKHPYSAMQVLCYPTVRFSRDVVQSMLKFSGLHAIAYFGIEKIMRHLPAGLEWESWNLVDDNGRTPLSWAAEKGHEGIVRLLVDRKDVVVDSKDSADRTPLSWAAENGHEGIVRLLVDCKGVIVDSKDKTGRTPLSYAARNGHEGIVRLLLDCKGVVVDSKDYFGQTPLQRAAENGHVDIVRLLVGRKDVVVDSKDNAGRTPLSLAAENGHESIVRLLVDCEDAVVNVKDRAGRTPLSWAAGNGHEGIVRLLVGCKDVIVDSKDRTGRTPLSWAARNGYEGIVWLLVDFKGVVVDSEDNAGRTPLSWTSGNGHEGIVRLLVDRNDVVVDSNDYRGRTPLSWAAENGHEDIVRLLLDCKGVVVHSEDDYGQIPLSWAARNGHGGIVRLLLDHKDVVVHSKGNPGRTLLLWAAGNGHEDIVRQLLDHKDVVVDSKDNAGRTPLSLAAANGHEGIVRLLVDRKDVVVDSNGYRGRTPLSLAAEKGREGIVRLLLDRKNVVVDSKDNAGRTPLSLAAEKGREGIVQLLLDHKDVVVDSKDNIGRTPLSWAANKGHEGIVRLLLDHKDIVVDSKDNVGRTPLSWAANKGHEGIVRLLLDHKDIVVDSKDNVGRTPLSWAVRNSHGGIVWLLEGGGGRNKRCLSDLIGGENEGPW